MGDDGSGDGGADADGAYLTVVGSGRATFEVRGSRFLGQVARTKSVTEAEEVIERATAEFADATHNVPAYRVRVTPERPSGDHEGERPSGHLLREWSSDADEPTGSAGKPALNVLARRDLKNVVAVVTRYYGGTNLGVGGLARAYARAVSSAIDAAGTVRAVPREQFTLAGDYDDSGTVRGILESAGVEFDADYGERVTFEVRVASTESAALRDRIRSATGGRVG